MRLPKARDARGFTLIEMMVVVAIISILVALAVNLRTTTYGANTPSVSDQLVANIELARMRAISTRRYERVTITPQLVTISQGNTVGMSLPASYTEIQQMILPTAVSIWDVTTQVHPTSGTAIAQNLALNYNLDFRPDGSCGGATLFVTDIHQSKSNRVIVYKVTGSAYSRAVW